MSCVEDLALWEPEFRQRHGRAAPACRGVAEPRPSATASPKLYARGVEVTTYRGLRTEDHGGLWPGYKTCFLRAPEAGITVIAIANHGGIDSHHLAHQLLDAASRDAPASTRCRACRAPGAGALAGRWLDPESATTIEFALDAAGEPTATQHGVPFALAATADGRLAARRGIYRLRRRLPEGDTLLVETDAGTLTRFHRAPEAPALPPGLAGTWHCAELDRLDHRAGGGRAGGAGARPADLGRPLAGAADRGRCLRILTPATMFQGWLDAKVERNAAGRSRRSWSAGRGSAGCASTARAEGRGPCRSDIGSPCAATSTSP